MYTIDTLKRKIMKEGHQATVDFLLSNNLPIKVKEDLTKAHVFNSDGYLSLSFLYSL